MNKESRENRRGFLLPKVIMPNRNGFVPNPRLDIKARR
jgi:hypothetical protein